jgi:hypothetical protein
MGCCACSHGDGLFIFESGKSFYHSTQRKKTIASKEGATALQKEGATVSALSLQSNPLPLYTKKKRDLSAAKLPPVPGHTGFNTSLAQW